MGLEKRDPAGGPQPTSDEKSGLQPHIRCACHAPQVFFKSRTPKRGRVLQDLFQQGATLLGFSTFNSTYVLTKSQVVWRDSVRSSEHLRATPSVRFRFIHEHRHEFPILRLCHVLDVSENGYYNWRTRGKSKRKWNDEQLAERIEDAYQEIRGKYGNTRIHAELKAQGIHCGIKRISRLMREKQLYARRKRRKVRTTNSHHQFPIASNLLKRDFTADAPNKKCVADITFIETQEGWLYLSGVLDIYSRKIVGWAMDACHNAELVKAALHMALRKRQPAAGLIHHSDRKSRICQLHVSTAVARAPYSSQYEWYRRLL